MTELIERLRATCCRQVDPERQRIEFVNPDGPEAAARIEALEKALEPFADFYAPNAPDGLVITQGSRLAARQLTMGDCRHARTTLKGDQPR